MSFFFPKITWKPKDIKGTIDVTEAVKSDKKLPINVNTENIRENFPEKERSLIDAYLTEHSDLVKDLDDIEVELEGRLKSISISYDPEKNPLLHTAHICPYCGNAHALNIITYEDIKNHKDGADNVNKTILKGIVPDNFGNMNSKEIASYQEQAYKKMQSDMLDQVWRQVLIWILEMLLAVVSPLRNVPGASAVPKKIEQWIDELKGKKISKKQAFTEDDELRKEQAINDYDKSVGNNNNLSSLGGLSRQCVIHHRDFNSGVETLLDGTQEEVYVALLDINTNIKTQTKAVDDLTSTVIPDEYEYPDYSTSGLKYINKRPETYLKARKDGSGVLPSFLIAGEEGTLEVLKNTKKEWVKNTKDVLTNWWESPDTLCCIINNILKVGNMSVNFSDGKELLLAMRTILQMYRNFLMFNFKSQLAQLFNLIINLINGVLTKLISGLAAMLKDKVNFDWLLKLKTDNESCLPWNNLLDTLGTAVKFFTEEFFSMLTDFIVNIKHVNIKVGGFSKNAGKILEIDKWLSIIDSIIKFMKVMNFCVINKDVMNDRLSNEDTLNKARIVLGPDMPDENTFRNIQNSQKSPTIYKGGRMPTTVEVSADVENGVTSSIPTTDSNKVSWALDKESMQILLTNYIGLSEEKANAVISSDGDCACDKSLSDEDLLLIQKTLSNRSINV